MSELNNGSEPPQKRYRRAPDADPINPDPSIVVHVRNLSDRATEADLIEALGNFGPIAYAVVYPSKYMGLVEFEDLQCATSCVKFAESNQIYVAGQIALFNYSTSPSIQRMGFESDKPNHTLCVTVFNVRYPITVDVLYEICKAHGEVRRIAIIRKRILHALIEYDTVEAATKAKHAINGADIYSGCCTLKVEYSKVEEVRVPRNDDDHRDYTQPDSGPKGPSRRPLIEESVPLDYTGNAANYGYAEARGDEYGRPGPPPPPDSSRYGYDEYGAARGGDARGASGYTREEPPTYYDRGLSARHGGTGEMDMGPQYAQPLAYGRGGEGCVMLMYGVDQEKLNCERIFSLLCLYGNVMRVKFCRNKVEMVIVEMGMPGEVENVIANINYIKVNGMTLIFKRSDQPCLYDKGQPFDLPDGTPSFRDFSESRNQRYFNAEAAARNRIVPPCPNLHWFTAPPDMDEEKIKELFIARNAPVPNSVEVFKTASERSRTGLAMFSSTEEATLALILANHTPIAYEGSKAPYIVKFAFSTPSRNDRFNNRDGAGGSRGGFQPRGERFERSERGSSDGRGRGRGRGSYRGDRGGGGDRGGRYNGPR